MRLLDYAWRLGLPPAEGSYLVDLGHEWARGRGLKLKSFGLALEIGVGIEDGWKDKDLRELVKRRQPDEEAKVSPEAKASLEPNVADVPVEASQPGLLERLRSKGGEERLTETYELRVGAAELAGWHAYAEREGKPLAWLIRRSMRDRAEFSRFQSDNAKGGTSDD